ncbi:MAG TPA: hypothetical protein VM533_11490 [Fimbriiglobus sp.]|jgi:hypothetical protein|nr:hypothetical protein [Fimbriiglobus sp.]
MWTSHPVWQLVELSPLAGGGLVAVLNFYLSFLREPLCRLRSRPYRFVSGLPLIGSILLVPFAAFHYDSPLLLGLSVLFLCLDTGGVVWLAVVVVREFGPRPRRS